MPPISASPENHAPGAPPLGASPSNSAENSPIRGHRDAKYTGDTNEDSGISEMEEAEKQKNMDYNIK